MSTNLETYHKKVMLVPYALYDFIDSRGGNVIQQWMTKDRLSKRDRGALRTKLDALAISGPLLAPRILAGPIKKTGHIYKLIIHGDVMLRPMLCKGPFSMDSEFTLLLGSLEIGGELVADPKQAVMNRETLLADKTRRVPNVRN